MYVGTCLCVRARERVCGPMWACTGVRACVPVGPCVRARVSERVRLCERVCVHVRACGWGGGSAAGSWFPLWRRPRVATGDTAPYEHFQTHRQAVYAPILYGRTFGKEKFPLTYVKIWKCLRKYPTWGLKVGMLKYEATESTFQGEFLRAAYAGQRGLRVSVGGGPPRSPRTEHSLRQSSSCQPRSRSRAQRTEIHTPRGDPLS